MKSLKLTIVLSVLCLASTALAGMTGTYKVINNECSFSLTNGTQAVVQATAEKLVLGVVYKNPDGHTYFKAAFDYKVGTERKGCLGDCYYLNTGSYSEDGNQFREEILYARFRDSAPIFHSEVTFTLVDDELEVQNGSKVCLLKKK